MSDQDLAVGYVLGEEQVAGRIVIDWIGVVYETRDEADAALADAYALGGSHLDIYALHSVKPLPFGQPLS